MSTSIQVIGYISEDDTYKKYAKILRACEEAGMKKIPSEVEEYFQTNYPELSALDEKLQVDIPKEDGEDDCTNFIDINIADIPKDVVRIRVIVGY